MIFEDAIREWQQHAPWPLFKQIEQDLVISRALVELYNHPKITETLAFRGGTALHKLFINPAARYSEDLDFVQINPEPIGETIKAIKSVLDHWLGEPKWSKKQGRVTLYYSFIPENESYPMRVKIEINTEEHLCLKGFNILDYQVQSRWFFGKTKIITYQLEELLATKLKGLYQRKKGRDLFDMWLALKNLNIDIQEMVKTFHGYLEHDGTKISRAQFEENLIRKLSDINFCNDIRPLLRENDNWDIKEAFALVQNNIFPHLIGEPWKGIKNLALEEI